jgi:phosphoserine/homoserine phosphotransferase
MYIVCLDMEGVVTPEIWINVAERTGIPELRLTTRDVSDYDVLMRGRLKILKERGLKLADIQAVIRGMDLLDGALEFLDDLRRMTQVIILSDTFTQFADPLIEKMGRPTLFCNTLKTNDADEIVGYELRQKNGKFHSVKALQSIGYEVFAGGDSFNDVAMLRQADARAFFRPSSKVVDENPDIAVTREYGELSALIEPLTRA